MAIIASATGTTRGQMQGSWRLADSESPGEKVTGSPCRLIVGCGSAIVEGGFTAIRTTNCLPVVYLVPQLLECLIRRGSPLRCTVRLRILPVAAYQGDRVLSKSDEILLRLEILAAEAEPSSRGTLANENSAALNLFALPADGDFCP